MTSKAFFGTSKFKDINVTLFNEDDDIIYKSSVTTFGYMNPFIDKQVEDALESYHKFWEYNGNPVKCEIYTTPSCNTCKIDLLTKMREFN